MFRIIQKLRQLLNRKQKVRILVIAAMMFVGGLLETFSAGMMIPLITAAMDDNLYKNNKYARMFCEFFDINSNRTFMISVLLGLIILFILKNVFMLFQIYLQNRFISNNKFSLQCEMLRIYMERPYEDFLSLGLAQISRAVSSNVEGVFAALTTVLAFCTDLVTSVILVIAIVVINPMIAASVSLVLLTLLFIISKILKPIMRKQGVIFMENSMQSSKWFNQSVHGIKEVKVGNKESFFQEQYNKYGKETVIANRNSAVLSSIPRLLIESFCMAGMLGVLAVMMYKGKELSELLPQLSAFAVAAVRLLPSANRISGYLTSISYQEPQIDEMLQNRKEIYEWKEREAKKREERLQNQGENEKEVELTFKNQIELSNITYFYPNTKVNILENANMVIPIGSSVGVVGKTGAGKTTAIDILIGLLEPSYGAVLTDDTDIRANYGQWLKNIGYIPQTIYMIDDTIRANIAFGYAPEDIDDNEIMRALSEAQLKDFVDGLPNGLDTTIGERGVRVSGGQRQRLGIARALYTAPDILIFDEATAALDNETEAAVMESINRLQGKKTMVIIAHRLTTIEKCDMVYRVEDKKIVRER